MQRAFHSSFNMHCQCDTRALNCGYRVDLFVDDKIVVELKSVEKHLPIHEAQLLTYMRVAHIFIGLLMNFNVKVVKDGMKRFVF